MSTYKLHPGSEVMGKLRKKFDTLQKLTGNDNVLVTRFEVECTEHGDCEGAGDQTYTLMISANNRDFEKEFDGANSQISPLP